MLPSIQRSSSNFLRIRIGWARPRFAEETHLAVHRTVQPFLSVEMMIGAQDRELGVAPRARICRQLNHDADRDSIQGTHRWRGTRTGHRVRADAIIGSASEPGGRNFVGLILPDYSNTSSAVSSTSPVRIFTSKRSDP